ncbi:MAG: glycosyltransferase family 4 protein [archaeon]|nr:glycosyltransferase family 4 protein [archaeon]
MKIAYLIREDISQLVSPCYYNLLPEFEKKGNEITVINLSGKFGKHKCIKASPKKFPDYPSGALNKLAFSSECRKIIEKNNFDLVFASASEYLHNLDGIKIPKIAMVQDEWRERMAHTPWFAEFSPLPMKSKFRQMYDARVQEKNISKADGIVFVNKDFASRFSAKNKTVIPNGLDFSSMKKNSKQISRIKKEFNEQIVLFLGRLELQKNPLLFAKIAQQLEAKTDAKFLMIGEGIERKSIESFIEKNSQKNLKLLGWMNGSKNDYLFASDIYIIPSLFDPCPVSLIEAMFSENAVIGSSVGGIKDAISHNKNGLLCENKNFDAFRNSAKLLLNHSGEAKKLSRNAKKTVQKDYSVKLIAKKYLDFFESVIK